VKNAGIVQGRSSYDDQHGLLYEDDASDHASEIDHSMPKSAPAYLAATERVEANLRSISISMEKLHGLHAVRVGSVFASDLSRRDREIDAITTDITTLFRVCERDLKGIIPTGPAGALLSDEEITVRKNVQRNLARRMQEMGTEFRKRQRTYLEDVAEQKGGGTDVQFGIDVEEAERARQHVESGLDSHHLSLVEEMEDTVLQRDEEITKIAQSINDLSTIFKELAVLVIDQGTILDRIDYNMEVVVERTHDGVKQLEKAEKSQKNARSMKCIMCQLITITILVVILILKHH